MLNFLGFLGLITISYLIGSLCSAVIVARLYRLPDPKSHGSNNPGATNMLRLAGKKYAIIVLLADGLKGFIPVFAAHLMAFPLMLQGVVALSVTIGHIYPVFFQFKGGKGVATALGTLWGINAVLGASMSVLWILIALVSRYSSLASIMTLLIAPFAAIVATKSPDAFLPLLGITTLVLYKHHANIKRLMSGEESKISFKKI